MSELQHNDLHFQPEELSSYLIKEIHAFSAMAEDLGYSQESMIISRHIICNTFDQIILAAHKTDDYSWKTLSSHFPHYESLQTQLKTIIDRMCQLPPAFIDVLEFVYICKSVTQTPDHSADQEQNLKQELYHIINHQRGDCEKRLSNNAKPSAKSTPPARKHSLALVFFVAFFILAFILAAAYGFFSLTLDHTATHIATQLSAITPTQ
jgi:type IV/VI secretion system ImpK/VasF family protein